MSNEQTHLLLLLLFILCKQKKFLSYFTCLPFLIVSAQSACWLWEKELYHVESMFPISRVQLWPSIIFYRKASTVRPEEAWYIRWQLMLSCRIWRLLAMVYNIQNHWLSGQCPSFGILNTRKHNVSDTGSVFVFRWGERERERKRSTLLGLLERASLN
jgi:hypothetical protein